MKNAKPDGLISPAEKSCFHKARRNLNKPQRGEVNNQSRDGLYLLVLGSLVLLMTGTVLSVSSAVDMIDYRAMYYPARCLMQKCNPYDEAAVLKVAESEGGVRPSDNNRGNNHFARYLYLPTAFAITCPFALLPWEASRLLWMALIGSGFVFAAFLMWDVGACYSPLLAGALLGFFLADNELLMVVGNVAAIAIILCIAATWCIVLNRFVAVGIICFAASLLLKPHDSGLVWLYFILAGGIYRRRAIQTVIVTVVLSLPAVMLTWIVAPAWIHDLHANIALDLLRGERSDPAIASMGSHGLSMMVNLQTVFGSYSTNPQFYNTAAYLVIGPLILIWITAILRSRFSAPKAWLAIGAAAALTMLPFYHRQYDTKLLMLTVPGCSILWVEGGVVGWIALILNIAAFVLTGDLSWIALLAALDHMAPGGTLLAQSILRYAQIFCAPLILLVIGTFYLWAYIRRGNVTPHDTNTFRLDYQSDTPKD